MELALRPISKDDIDGIVALARVVCQTDDSDSVTTREAVASYFDMPSMDMTKVWWVLPGSGGRLDASIAAVPLPGRGKETIHIDYVVHPDRRRQWLEEQLILFAEAQAPSIRVRPDLPCLYHISIETTQTQRGELLRRLGYTAVRWFLFLKRPLAVEVTVPPVPGGLRVEAADGLGEADDVFLAIDESFRDHWSPTLFTMEQYRHMYASIASAPILSLVARGPVGDPAGVCISRVSRERNEERGTLEGSVCILGVRRPYRGRGLATSMLLRSLDWLREHGMTVATIGVDADSPTGANRLYERVGFIESKRAVVYQKPERNNGYPSRPSGSVARHCSTGRRRTTSNG